MSDATLFGRAVIDRLTALEVSLFGGVANYSDITNFERAVLARIGALELQKFGSVTVEPDTTSFTRAVLDRLTALESGGGATILTAPALSGNAIVGQPLFASAGTYNIVPDSIDRAWLLDDLTATGDVGDNHLCDNIEQGRQIKYVETAHFGATTLTNPSAFSAAIAARTVGAVALTRTSALGASPLTYSITLPADCYPGDVLTAETSPDTTFGDTLQKVAHALTAAEIADPTLLPAAFTTEGFTDPGSTDFMRVVLAARLPDDTVVSSVSGSVGKNDTFTPGALSGLAIWNSAKAGFRFTDTGATVAANNGDAIAALKDRSSGAHNVTNGTLGNRPLAVDSGGFSWASFDGTNDTLNNTAPPALTNASGEWTAFASVKFNSVAGVQSVNDADSASTRLAQFIRMNAGNFETIAFKDNALGIATFTAKDSGAPRAISTWYDVIARCSTTAVEIYVGGTLIQSTPVTAALQVSNIGYSVGATNTSSPGQWLNGQITDCGVVGRAITPTEIASLNTYLTGTHP